MVTFLRFADVIWLIFLYSIFYAALPNVEGSEPGYREEKNQTLYRCNLEGKVKKPSSLVLNWKVDRENMEMTWDSNVNVTDCEVDTPPNKCGYGKPEGTMCSFQSVMLHKGATFIATIEYLNQTLVDSIYFPPEEMDGTSAENFSCVLYNVSFMNCTWDAGRNAPDDVQYFLYLTYSKEYSGQKRQCMHYINNTLGRHIACHIPGMTLTTQDSYGDMYYIYVNGSSKKTQIRYYDVLLKLCEHERLGPPQSIIKNCSNSLPKCRIQWTPPLNNENCCCTYYEIQDGTKNTTISVSENHQTIDVEGRHIVRIRAFKNPYDVKVCGEWSEPIILELPGHPTPLPIVTLILVAVGTTIMIFILVFICQRYHIWHKLTAPVPQPKDLFQQYTKNTENDLGDPIPRAHEPDEKITLIEEVTGGLKK